MNKEEPKSAFAPATGYEPWISTNLRLPEDGQVVAFVIHGGYADVYAGRVLGGKFTAGEFGGFSVPGMTFWASFWMPLPDAPRFHNHGFTDKCRIAPAGTQKPTGEKEAGA